MASALGWWEVRPASDQHPLLLPAAVVQAGLGYPATKHYAIGDAQTEAPLLWVIGCCLQYRPIRGLLGAFQPVAVDAAKSYSTFDRVGNAAQSSVSIITSGVLV